MIDEGRKRPPIVPEGRRQGKMPLVELRRLKRGGASLWAKSRWLQLSRGRPTLHEGRGKDLLPNS